VLLMFGEVTRGSINSAKRNWLASIIWFCWVSGVSSATSNFWKH